MFAIELLHNYTPEQRRREAAKVIDNTAEHLTAAERADVEKLGQSLDAASNTFAVFAMQHVGPMYDACDLASTIAAAGEALCQFALTRALINPHELAAVKTGIAECWLAVSDLLAKVGEEGQRQSMAGHAAAREFIETQPERFIPLFEDLEAQARRKFPHMFAEDEAQQRRG